jgi:tRNA-modifying protein YgfZ
MRGGKSFVTRSVVGTSTPSIIAGVSIVEPDPQELRALEEGRAFVELSAWRKVRVCGSDAIRWLHDLLTADIAGLTPGAGCRSLLLTPTGRIRADVHVARRADDVMLLQAPEQPGDIGLALRGYVVSSDVSLEDRTNDLALMALPGRAASLVDVPDGTSPSTVGPGTDALVATGEPAARLVRSCVGAGLEAAGPDALEAWRIRRGTPRMGVDFDERSLPAEAGLDDVIDSSKGCFLGQESVARVRNLGHPAHVLRHLRGRGRARRGEHVFAAQRPVGEITSATTDGELTVIASVRWEAADASLALADGRTLIAVPPLA